MTRIVVATILGIVLIPVGSYALWAEHSGVLAPVKVIECDYAGRGRTCTGQWKDSSGIHFVGLVSADYPNVGDVSPMRIHGVNVHGANAID